MNIKTKFKPRALKNRIPYDSLIILLTKQSKNKWQTFFCFHNWIYWRYANFGKMHRVCNKCYKKQKSLDVFNKSSLWIKDDIFQKLSKKYNRKNKIENILK
jgi:hypothetical protein